MDENYDEIPRHKKKAKKKGNKKSDHRHEYMNCVFGYNGQIFSREHGFLSDPRLSIGTYCPKCGKVGHLIDSAWINDLSYSPTAAKWKDLWTDRALKEFDVSTRSLPYFWLDDWFQKYINDKKD